jgi:molybdopterin/thiamine biosynthesis adenylyltransferase
MNYDRNFLYITPAQQTQIKDVRILFAGVGIGSVIAECLVRLGFENFILVDGDIVEESNLNRQNYTHADIVKHKVEALENRLRYINPNVKIETYPEFLDENNIEQYIQDCDIAVNALDFASDIPFVFDRVCRELTKPVIHPYNLGWASLVYVVTPDSIPIEDFCVNRNSFQIQLVQKILQENTGLDWLEEALMQFASLVEIDPELSPPQLSVGCHLAAGIVARLCFQISTGSGRIKTFPEYYLLSS